MNRKYSTHIVIKREDVEKYLFEKDIRYLYSILDAINSGREFDKKAINNHYVCNMDEPYADKVLQAIIAGEKAKEANHE